MKRILLLTDSLISGGAQRQIVGLSKLLNDANYNVKLIYYHPIEFYKPFLDNNGINNELIKGAEDGKKRIMLIAKAIRRYSPDVVISYLDVPNIIVCLLRALGMKYKLIVSERNTTQVLSLRERLKFFLMRWADMIVSNSYSQTKFIKEHYKNLSSRSYTITNFVDTDVFCPAESTESDVCRMLVVGRVADQKNTLRFLTALRRLKNDKLKFHVNWFGYSDPQYQKLCEDYIDDNNLQDVFTFNLPTTDIVSQYQNHDVFVLPSIYEGFPNVICEAMSCGKPILCSRICDNPQIVEEGTNGFMFDPRDVEDIYRVLERYITLSEEEKLGMGHQSRQLSSEKFSADKFIERYIELIEK